MILLSLIVVPVVYYLGQYLYAKFRRWNSARSLVSYYNKKIKRLDKTSLELRRRLNSEKELEECERKLVDTILLKQEIKCKLF